MNNNFQVGEGEREVKERMTKKRRNQRPEMNHSNLKEEEGRRWRRNDNDITEKLKPRDE